MDEKIAKDLKDIINNKCSFEEFYNKYSFKELHSFLQKEDQLFLKSLSPEEFEKIGHFVIEQSWRLKKEKIK